MPTTIAGMPGRSAVIEAAFLLVGLVAVVLLLAPAAEAADAGSVELHVNADGGSYFDFGPGTDSGACDWIGTYGIPGSKDPAPVCSGGLGHWYGDAPAGTYAVHVCSDTDGSWDFTLDYTPGTEATVSGTYGGSCVNGPSDPTPTATPSAAPGQDTGVYVDPSSGSLRVDENTGVALGVAAWLASVVGGLACARLVLP